MIHRRDLGSIVATYPTRAEMGHHCVLNEWHSIHKIDAFCTAFLRALQISFVAPKNGNRGLYY
jgi:hypothetical protein